MYQDVVSKINYEYTPGSGEASVASYNDVSGNLSILSSFVVDGMEYTVTQINWYAFQGCTNLQSIVIPNTVAGQIGFYAFQYCTSLSYVKLSSSLWGIGDYCFNGATSLKSIEFPKSIANISYHAFSNSGLESVIIPDGITWFGRYDFMECPNLRRIVLPNVVSFDTDWGGKGYCSNFNGCNSLEEVVCRSITPPVVLENPFDDIDLSQVVLYVPTGAKEQYLLSAIWSEFKEIIEIDIDSSPTLLSSSPQDGDTGVPTSGEIILTFDEIVKIRDNAMGKLNEIELAPLVNGNTIIFEYIGLEQKKEYTFTMPGNSVTDLAGNIITEDITLSFSTEDKLDTVAKPKFSWEGDRLAISTTTTGADIYYSTKEYDVLPSGDGTLSSPYNVAGVLQYISTLGADNPSPNSVYIKGIVSSIRGIYTKYGNADFYISDNGRENGSSFYGWRVYDLGGQFFTSEDAFKVGDEVIIYGKVTNYRGITPETEGYSAYIYAYTTPEPNTLYQEPIVVEDNVVVRAKATKQGMDDSEMAIMRTSVEPYAVLNNDNTVLTFYYDKMQDSREGMNVGPFTYNVSTKEVNSGWYKQHDNITTLVFDDSFANCTTITSTAWWFYGCKNLTTIKGIENLKTDYVTDMKEMFDGCSALASLDVSSFNTINVENMSYMFGGCSSLSSLDVSNFNTTNVTNMDGMFLNCASLTSLDLSGFNTAIVTNMSGMFFGCNTLTSLDLSSFNTANVLNMSAMFAYCGKLTNLDLTNFNTFNVQFMYNMFLYCRSLTSLDLSNFNTANVIKMQSMFEGCYSITTIFGGNWNKDAYTDGRSMFKDCLKLVGGAGTVYNSENANDNTYAHIDGGSTNPGYFTEKEIELIGFSDWLILKQFYNEYDGELWTRHWNISDESFSVNNFPGIATKEGRVIEIDLSDNNIEGSFPFLLFSLPYLQVLNIAGNRFSGDINVQQDAVVSTSLQELNISRNQLSGNIGSFATCCPNLTFFNASDNCFEDVFPMISPRVTTLNISKQTISRVVPLHLSKLTLANVATKIPTILIYDHANRTYSPNISLLGTTQDGDFCMSMVYRDGQLSIPYVSEQNTYYGESGDTLNVAVLNADGTPEGSTFRISLGFDEGDGNCDGKVNVLDLQATLNYMFGEYKDKPYNFTASNLYKDEVINVQDVVLMVDKLLSIDGANNIKRNGRVRTHEEDTAEATDACLYWRDGELILNTTVGVTAADICFMGDASIAWDLKQTGFIVTERKDAIGTHAIIYSLSGAETPVGETVIAHRTDGEAEPVSVLLSDRHAAPVSVSLLASDATAIGRLMAVKGDWTIFRTDGTIAAQGTGQAQLKSARGRLAAGLYILQGNSNNTQKFTIK